MKCTFFPSQDETNGSFIPKIRIFFSLNFKMSSNICDFQQCCMCDQQRLRPACAYAQSDQSLCWSPEYSMNIKLLTEHHLEFLTLIGGCTGSSESIHVEMPHGWKITCRCSNITFFCTMMSYMIALDVIFMKLHNVSVPKLKPQ